MGMESLRPAHVHDSPPTGRSWEGVILSIGFWACAGCAAVLFGAVSLAPRVVERARLERDYFARQSELVDLQGEVQHLERLVQQLERAGAGALQEGADRRPREGVDRGVSLPLSDELKHDPRHAPVESAGVPYSDPWYVSILAGVAASRERQRDWSLLAGGLLLFGFVFLHEQAGSRCLARSVVTPCGWLVRRYWKPPGDPNGV